MMRLNMFRTYLRGCSRCLHESNSCVFISNRFLTNRYPSTGLLVIIMTHGRKQYQPFTCYFFQSEHNIYLHFMSFLHTDLTHVVETLNSCKTRTCLVYKINIMAADDLATQGVRASATMILTMLDRINSGFKKIIKLQRLSVSSRCL